MGAILHRYAQGRRNVSRAGVRKKLRAMQIYEKQKNRYQLSNP